MQGSTVALALPLSGVPSADAALRFLQARLPEIEIEREVGALSHVGVGVGADASELLALLSDLNAVPSLLVATPLRVSAVLPLECIARAERELHSRSAA